MDRFGVTVVIPTFNRRDALVRAIDSVASTRTSCVEIVVVDDGSTTDPRGFLRPMNAHGVPIRCFRMERNRGPQAARNLGIRRARYPYIAFLDSDDAFHVEKIDLVLAELEARPVDLLFHGVSGMGKYNFVARLWSRHLATVVPFSFLAALYNPVATPALVIRRRRRLGLPRLRHCEDYFFLLRYASPGVRVRYLEKELSAVFRRPGTLGGLSGNSWRMRAGEFVARRALLKERTGSGLARYLAGTAAGLVRVVGDIIRGRYWK